MDNLNPTELLAIEEGICILCGYDDVVYSNIIECLEDCTIHKCVGCAYTGDLLAQWKYKLLQVQVLEVAIDKAMLDPNHYTDSWATPWYKLPEWEQLVEQRKVLTELAELLTPYELEQASDYYQNNQ